MKKNGKIDDRHRSRMLSIAAMCLFLITGFCSGVMAEETQPAYVIYLAEELTTSSATSTEIEMFFNSVSNATSYQISAETEGVSLIEGTEIGTLTKDGAGDGSIKFKVQSSGKVLSAGDYQFSVIMTGDDCPSEAHSFTVKVLGKPVLDPFTGTSSVCNGTNNVNAVGIIMADGAVIKYTWTAVLKTSLNEAEQALVTFEIGDNGTELEYNSEAKLTTTVENNLDIPVEVDYTMTPVAYFASHNNLKVVGESKTWTVKVQPTAKLTSNDTITAVCDGSPIVYTPTSNVSSATFAWSRAEVTNVTPDTGTGTDSINETLRNSGSVSQTVTYEYTITNSTCSAIYPVTVNVHPTPVLNTAPTIGVVCSGTPINYTPGCAVTGTDYKWSRTKIEGITEPAKVDVPGNITDEALHNTTGVPIEVTYVYTLLANGCTNTANVNVTVNPELDLSLSKTTETVCNGTILDVAVTSTLVRNNKVKWVAETQGSSITGFTNHVESDFAVGLKIKDTLINDGTEVGTVTYTVTQTYTNGSKLCEKSVVFVVTVAPKIEITSVSEQIVCSEDATETVVFVSNVSNLVYTWEFEYDPNELTVDPTNVTITDVAASGRKNAKGNGPFSLTKVTRADNATDAVTVGVTVTGTLTSGAVACENTHVFNVTVKPKPKFKLGKR